MTGQKRQIKTAALAAALTGLATASTHAGLIAYEGFDYTAGSNINTPLNGGVGFSGPWLVGQQGGVLTVYDETVAGTTQGNVGGEIEWDGVVDNLPTSPAVGSRFVGTGTSGADRITGDRVLAQSAGAMAGGDGVLWASIVWHQQGNNFGRHVGFTLGTDGLANRAVNIDSSGVGIGVGGAFNTGLVTPATWNSGAVDVRTTTGAANVSYSEDNIIILKFEFGATDTVTAYRFLESDVLSEATFNANAISATATFNIDENTLNTISFSQSRGQEAVDEIRLGDTFLDVVPEPGSLALIAMGGLCVLRRRRG